VVSGSARAKGDLVISQGDESVVGNGDAMRVVAEITERMLGASEGALGVDVPVVSEQDSDPGGEGVGVSKGFQLLGTVQPFQILPEVRSSAGSPPKIDIQGCAGDTCCFIRT
jgi:hypothetical protein